METNRRPALPLDAPSEIESDICASSSLSAAVALSWRLLGFGFLRSARVAMLADVFMLIVHVHVHVKPEGVEAFKQATLINASASLREPGVVRFEVVQQADDPTRFVMIEVFRDAAGAGAHKETPHYAVWRDAVSGLMAEPRASTKFSSIFPCEI